ncbi:hypothetical protein ASPSYDRAFT_86431 [Aspergillus sydowii CBS 593.65]|uniref:DUF1754-domain-containing protein n=1 Tax=Aspergillus sydowii CBS 593.65 TaxID=1036612 RepID=A0A1L9TTV0_9EURO|nr:uncharacterized protein ASPSYDRAFT_86431 [Aspergillus sydowii CBS 593.65]OJJ62778.1 hypothetical protein ASPSYDRAFT_86431 [Aspergillus sydowii CBS 593.65]
MDEYSAGGGGKLKLKGAKVSDGRVKKKKSSKKSSSATTAAGAGGAEKEREKNSEAAGEERSSTGVLPGEEREEGDGSSTPQSQSHAPAKTEAEKRHEEMRRKRALERLKREGIKTHKERVEELNKYLSRLSEHHDMPKIGPG